MHHLDAVRGKLRLRPDARQQQKLRRVDRAAAQDHLAPRADAERQLVLDEIDPGRALALEADPLRQRTGDHPQIGPVHHRMQIAFRGRAAPAPRRGGLVVADAVLRRAVEVGVVRIAEIVAGTDERLADLVLVRHVGDRQRAAGAVPVVGAAHLVLGPLEVGQHVARRPAGAAHLPPQVEVLVLAADIDHAVDRGRPAQHLAARPEDPPPVGAGIGLGLVAPVHRGVREGLAEPERNVDPAIVVLPAGLQQHDARGRVLRQPRRHDAAGGARPHHDEIRLDQFGHCVSPSACRPVLVGQCLSARAPAFRPCAVAC